MVTIPTPFPFPFPLADIAVGAGDGNEAAEPPLEAEELLFEAEEGLTTTVVPAPEDWLTAVTMTEVTAAAVPVRMSDPVTVTVPAVELGVRPSV